MWKKVLAVALMLILLALPLAARWLYFYQGQYTKRAVPPRPDLAAIKAPTPEMASFIDRYTPPTPGTILVDLAHKNRFEVSELDVLQARLSARDQWIEPVETASSLTEGLRHAKALLIISPGKDFTPDEIQHIKTFVDKGGRLLLVTDPTRFDALYDELGFFTGLDSDVIHVNDLAAQFGLVFQSDYLYNTVENEGNFRNIKLNDLAENALTEGLEQVVFYAAHSIVSEEAALITADGETRSSDSERIEELVVAVLAADGAVLALGDLTFMTEPYNAVYDNDQLVANIADFLSGAQREYELADFPFFFADEVDLMYAGDPLLDSDMLAGGGTLQGYFADRGKVLTVREAEDQTHDTLFFGLYEFAKDVSPYLTAAGVTLLVTPTETLEKVTPTPTATLTVTTPVSTPLPTPPTATLTVTTPVSTPQPPTPTATLTAATPTPTATFMATAPTPTATLAITTALGTPQPPTVTLGVTSTAEVSSTVVVSPTAARRVEIASLGQMMVTGTALLVLQTDGERHVLVVLANTEAGLKNVVERLTEGDLEDCLFREVKDSRPTTLALCPSGEVAVGEGDGGWQRPGAGPAPTATPTPTPSPTAPADGTAEPTEPAGEPEGNIIIVAFDDGEGRYDSMTSAEDYATILERRFDVTVWSTARDGLPEAENLLDYDLVIWTAGDFENAIGEEESELILPVVLEGKPMIISGAYLDETAPTAVQRDIQVKDADHPMTRGFDEGEVIRFVSAPSGQEYEIGVMEADMDGEIIPIFVRGPDSEESGANSIVVLADELLELRVAFIGFPIYLLPQDAKSRLVMNTVDWMLTSEE